MGAPVEAIHKGGACPPPEKMRTSRTLPRTVRNCYKRESMQTSLITTMGLNWVWGLGMTPYGSVVGAVLLHSQKTGMKHPQVQ